MKATTILLKFTLPSSAPCGFIILGKHITTKLKNAAANRLALVSVSFRSSRRLPIG